MRVELTAARRTALHRYTFPLNTTEPRMLVDITNDGQRSGIDTTMTLDPMTGRVIGGASFAASFGPGRYNAFTCVDFRGEGFDLQKPTEWGAWLVDTPVLGTTNVAQIYLSFLNEAGGLLTFPPAPEGTQTKILARVGVSLISTEQACQNAEEEIPDFDFERVHQDNRATWNDLLGRVQVDMTGVPLETAQLFYSSVSLSSNISTQHALNFLPAISVPHFTCRL